MTKYFIGILIGVLVINNNLILPIVTNPFWDLTFNVVTNLSTQMIYFNFIILISNCIINNLPYCEENTDTFPYEFFPLFPFFIF